MPNPTLLDLVQDLLSASSGDTVNSIFDTAEAEQVARIVGDCYKVLRVRLSIPEVYGLFELEASGTSTKPVYMTRPSTFQTIDWVRYDAKEAISDPSEYQNVECITLEEFLSRSNDLDPTQDFVDSGTYSVNNASVELRYRNDEAPSYFAFLSPTELVFNSYDSTVDTTLQKTKTLCYGRKSQAFSLEDTWEIPFDEAGVALLTQDSKTQLGAELHQMENALSAKKARVVMSLIEQPYRIDPYPAPYNYGRKSRK